MLLINHILQAVILAEVNGSPGSFDYAVFYSVALRFLEKDPLREVAFAILTEPNLDPSLYIHMWNETLVNPKLMLKFNKNLSICCSKLQIYPNDKEWKTETILSWIYKYLHQATMWISPTGSKGQQLSSYIQSDPAIILFTPRNPLMQFVDYYDMVSFVFYRFILNLNLLTQHSSF